MSRESWASIAGELDGTTGIDRLEEELAEARDEIARLREEIGEHKRDVHHPWHGDT